MCSTRHTCLALLAGLTGIRQADDEFGVAQHRDVRIVRRENELQTPLFLAHLRNHAFGDEPIIQIVLRLIDHERCL